ncbi:hypothetical protein GCM10023172_04960 [Hymenobacter ginsengisoli]|uniref:Uncharacterized protein n=1 Tax=Hymenobacter ginsengisoli TaxID=1051626 RepID=A0ABP8PXB8_9BACT|nr:MULTISPECIES: hypothetical protein [unclassified Hymenobacter]MBO2030598.1 hypothetical protein [Hymenobacter sp. BT559]
MVIGVRPRIREEFSNGKEYYQFDGKPLKVLPKSLHDQHAKLYLHYHNERFLG